MSRALSKEQRHRLLETEQFIASLDVKFQGKLEFSNIRRPDGTQLPISKKFDKNSFELGFLDYRRFLQILSESGFIDTAKKYSPEFQFGFLQFLATPDLEYEEGLKGSLQRMNQILGNFHHDFKHTNFKNEVKAEVGEALASVSFNFNWPVAREVIESLLSPRGIRLINRGPSNIPLSEYSRSAADVAFKTALRNTVRSGTEVL
ncbi:MAG: hypothetical protein KGH54_00750 [Candidatus Micrarchaeota archaeon]|nr:hypothetical protein [Candidatus Micrarchaeota archaeon]